MFFDRLICPRQKLAKWKQSISTCYKFIHGVHKINDGLIIHYQDLLKESMFTSKQFGIKVHSSIGIISNQCKNIKLVQNNFISRFIASMTHLKLHGKVAVVTASTDGIGFAIARRLAKDGAQVMISSRKLENVNAAVAKLKELNLDVSGTQCHVGKSEDRKKLFEKTIKEFGKLNILVSNAAVSPSVGAVLDCEEEVWDKIFDINVKSSYLLAKEALPYLRKQNNSSIVFVSSIAGYNPFELLGVYSVTKTALIGLIKSAAKQLAPEGIRVNGLAPGVIKTRFSSALYESETALEETLRQIPMQRLGEPDEMGGVVSFLVSDDASFLTGETIVASGGMISRL